MGKRMTVAVKRDNTIAARRPDLLEEWDWEKNAELGLDPYKLGSQSNKKAWWRCPECGYSWQSVVQSRKEGSSCPCCTGRVAVAGVNDLATTHENLVSEWDYDNNEKTPQQVTAHNGFKASWVCAECGNHYVAPVNDRVRGRGCPKCGLRKFSTSRAVPKPGDSLGDRRPDLIAQWHPNKNGSLTPFDFRPCSNKKVWWLCEFGHEWEASINNRSRLGRGCPECAAYAKTSFPEKAIFYYVRQVFDDAESCSLVEVGDKTISLDVWIPSLMTAIEYDGYHWHTNASRDKSKDAVCFDGGIRLIRVSEPGCASYNDIVSTTRIGRYDAHSASSLDDAIRAVLRELGCDGLVSVDTERDAMEIKASMVAARIKNSFGEKYPELASSWHQEKNGNLTPYMVSQHSRIKVWFICAECGREYRMAVADRSYGERCPACAIKEAGRAKMMPDDGESLAEKYPEIASSWHTDKNGDMTPHDVKPQSNKRFWWKCSNCGAEWESNVQHRVKAGNTLCRSCSILSAGKKRRKDPKEFLNRVADKNPNTEVIGSYEGCGTKVSCQCKKCGHVWDAWPQNLLRGHGCDICAREQRRETRARNRSKRRVA